MTKEAERLYCAKCKHRPTCDVPCAPVEELLRTVETRDEHTGELPRAFIEQLQNSDDWPESGKTKKRLILELYFLDGREQHEIEYIVGTTQQYVSRVIVAEKKRLRVIAKPKYTIGR